MEEDVRHRRRGGDTGVDKVRDISKSYFCFSRGSFRLIRSRNFRPVLGSRSRSRSRFFFFFSSFPVLSSMIIGEFVFPDDAALPLAKLFDRVLYPSFPLYTPLFKVISNSTIYLSNFSNVQMTIHMKKEKYTHSHR